MSRTGKLLLGFATIWPILYVCGFVIFVGSSAFLLIQSTPQPGQLPLGGVQGFMMLFGLHLLTMLWMMALMVFYLVHLVKTERIESDKKLLWAALLILGGMFAMPVYWYLNIWSEPASSISTTG